MTGRLRKGKATAKEMMARDWQAGERERGGCGAGDLAVNLLDVWMCESTVNLPM